METVRASLCWDGPKRDILYVFREPTPEQWQVDPLENAMEVSLLEVLDEREQETGEIAGVEVIDFLLFDKWDALPQLPLLWQLPGWEPLPLDELLKRVQQALRHQIVATTDY